VGNRTPKKIKEDRKRETNNTGCEGNVGGGWEKEE